MIYKVQIKIKCNFKNKNLLNNKINKIKIKYRKRPIQTNLKLQIN